MGWSGLGAKRAWPNCSAIAYLGVAGAEIRTHHSVDHVAVAAAVARMLAVLEVEKLRESCGRVPVVAHVAFAPAYWVA